MQKINPANVEMIRRREPAGFRFSYRSFIAQKVAKAPAVKDLHKLSGRGWWDTNTVITGFTNSHDGRPAEVGTRLRIVYDRTCLFAAFRMEEPHMDCTRTLITRQGQRQTTFPHPEYKAAGLEPFPYSITKDDHIRLLFDIHNTRRNHIALFANMAGVHLADTTECTYAEAVYPVVHSLEPWKKPYRVRVVKAADHWLAVFVLPWRSLGLKPEDAGMMGINAARGRTVREWHNHLLCPAPDPDALASFDFGHLHFGRPLVNVPEIDLGRPVLDANKVTMRIKNTSGRTLKITCEAEAGGGTPLSVDSRDLTLAAGKTRQVKLNYRLDWHQCSLQGLRISIIAAGIKVPAFTTVFELGNHAAPVPAEYRWQFPKPTLDPSPDDPAFLDKKLAYLLSRIPKFVRVTTPHGAPSDFTLRSVDGRWEFNLMQPRVLTAIADMIAALFKDRTDRLCALSLLAHQDAFSLHIAPHVAMHRQISALSALRLNAGHCYSRALVWLGIARELKTGRGRQRHGKRAHALLVMGHVIGAIECNSGRDRYVFDPSWGTFYYRWDNRGLATQAELAADLDLAERGVRGRRKDFINLQCHTPIPDGPVVFPQLGKAR